jgi:CMP-N-acetylneuraminic acid synthetase
MKVLALICARGNSKGIKKKNLLKFNNTTLIGHAIKQALQSKYIDDVVVSTDSSIIAREAKKNGAHVPFMRPAKLATDKSPEIDSWKHAVRYLNAENKYNFVVSVPTTSPLRKVSDIDKCINKAIKEDLDIVFSLNKSSKNPYFNMVIIKNRKLRFLFNNTKRYKRRQDAPIFHDITTICYVFKPGYIFNQKDLFKGKVGYVIFPKERAIDIDDKIDYKIAKFFSLKGLS